jgi:3-phytase
LTQQQKENLTADGEGTALYLGQNGTGYLIVSSQGSSSFVVYDRAGDNAYIGTFSIIQGDNADAVSGIDGLDVSSVSFGDAFPNGLLVVQDDLNINPQATQNFKLVSRRSVAEALGLAVHN